ncbi:MAG: threonylcarbamoyl-AMP synthase [Synergistaceae bacterium]|jgi:L-threonylcarbamoyladenylate synthase|nr:threonylcarbamoyl-AMP synthase [Synergistaceae bacterium]
MIVQPSGETIREAAEILRSGGLVAFPTETVYGLGANALDPQAVRKIFEAKGRPQDNPLILHISSIEDAVKLAVPERAAESLMRRFWPGPLTIVLQALDVIPSDTRAGLETVALRMPKNDIALALIRQSGVPIAAPSANRSGRPSPTTAAVVQNDLGDSVDMIIDGGPTPIGVESTVVCVTGDTATILRPGGVTREMLSLVTEVADCPEDEDEIKRRSPGTRHRHYAPSIPLILSEDRGDLSSVCGGKWCYMGITPPPPGAFKTAMFQSVDEYAHGMFSALRDLESTGASAIIAELPEDRGLGAAVRNRLMRAAETK